jgi:glycosyltransferase involved in cell wall biosynthesis
MNTASKGLRVAFVAGLSPKKLEQKITPLANLDCVEHIDVYRREPFAFGEKVRWISTSPLGRRHSTLGELEKLARLLAGARGYDLIVGCFQLFHGLWASCAGSLFRVPTIQLVLTDVDWNHERFFARLAMMRADACGVRGNISRQKLRTLGYKGPIGIFHNPITLPEVNSCQDIPKNFDCLAVGDFAKEKDYPWMLEILASLKARGIPVRARLCGRGFERLAPTIRSLDLKENLDFPGHLGGCDLDDSYRRSKMLIMTSKVEGLPMVAVEAMSHGLPVVATDVGEIPWLVRDRVEGFVVPYRDTGRFVDTMASLFENEKQRAVMGLHARKRIDELSGEFQLKSISEEWLKLLRSLRLIS